MELIRNRSSTLYRVLFLWELHKKMQYNENTIKEIETQFEATVQAIEKISNYKEDRIRKALFILCEEAGALYPLDGWKHDYLTLNAGKRTKEILNYLDTEYNKWIGISIKSLRLMEADELEKEIC